MNNTDYKSINELILKQEELLQFNSFNNQDAWNLGKQMVEDAQRANIELAICIRKLNGNIIFQYATEKTNLNNQNWMNRKFNTVSLMERSSLGAMVDFAENNDSLTRHGLSESEYALCGGGFPVRLKGSSIVAVITVSNLPHVEDHEFIIKSLSRFLMIEGVPEVDQEI